MRHNRTYCPNCGEAFQIGEERCARCGAPLPVGPPDRDADERAAHARATGPALARSCLRRGFRLLGRRPALLVLPLLFAAAGQVSVCAFIASHSPPAAVLARAPRAARLPVGLAAQLWLQQQLGGRWAADTAARAGARMCAPVPVVPFATNATFGVTSTAVYIGALWADALLPAVANALLWRGMWRALSAVSGGANAGTSTNAVRGAPAPNARGSRWDGRLLAAVLALSALGPAQMALVGLRSRSPGYAELTVLFDVAALALATAGCAVVVAVGRRDPIGSLVTLWARTLFSVEGVMYAALSIAGLAALSYVADFVLFVRVGLPPAGAASGWMGVLALVRACATAVVASGTTLGFFCLLERYASRTASSDVREAEAVTQ